MDVIDLNFKAEPLSAEIEADLAASAQPSQTVVLLNDGLEDKRELILTASDEKGNFRAWLLQNDLARGQRVQIPISELGYRFISFTIRWRGKSGIARYSCKKDASAKHYFTTMMCWFMSSSPAQMIEETLVHGKEARL